MNKENLKKLTLVFLFLMPFSDYIYFFSKITTLIKIIIILIIFLLTIYLYKDSRKNLKKLLIYYSLAIIYLFFNYLHSKNFISYDPNNFNYNFFNETLTIIKLMMPITLIYSLYYQKFNKKDSLFIIKSWVLIIGLTIIITNIFKISLGSYSDATINYNIFEWHKGLYYIYSSSRGLFKYANQEALIMLVLLILEIYETIKTNKKNIIYILILMFAMLMLGTRVSSIGGLLILISCFIIYFIFVLFKKEKYNSNIFYLLIPIFIWLFILPISPYSNRNVELNKPPVINNISPNDNTNKEKKELSKTEYIDSYHNDEKLPKVFYTKYYSYEYDSDFWYDFVKNTPDKNINYRYIEEKIIERVEEVNNNYLDVFLGISNSRIQNIVNIEKDYVEQYYAFGIIGLIILLFIYPLMFILSLIKFIKDRNYDNFILSLTMFLWLVVPYLTGNIINSLTTIIPFAFFASLVLKK